MDAAPGSAYIGEMLLRGSRVPNLLIALVLLGGAGCGASAPSSRASRTPSEPSPELATSTPPSSEGAVARAELEQVLERGLGRFLQGIETEPHLEGGRFLGHRVRALHAPLFQQVDLAPGDTLLRVNGMEIERPEQALAVWTALRVASELTIDYSRAGERRQLRFAIEE